MQKPRTAKVRLVGWGVGEDPGYAEDLYQGYGGYTAQRRSRSSPTVVAATNLGEYVEEAPEYSEVDYGAYVKPPVVSPSCGDFKPQPGPPSRLPDQFRPIF